VANTLLAAVKGWLGLLTGSLALIADTLHTVADSGTSVIVILGFRLARKPPDAKHPFGHGRIESVASVVIAVLLGVVAVEMARACVGRILRPQDVHAPAWAIVVVFVTMLAKELLARFSATLGRLIGSDALLADAWHHRSDVFATGLVIAAFLGSRWGAPWLDGVMGVGVAALIGWAAVATMLASLGPILGEHAPDATYRDISRIARAVEGVSGVHDIIVHRYGLTHVISLHVEVSDAATPAVLHDLADDIEQRIARRFPGHAVVHVDPVNRQHPHYAAIERLVQATVDDSAWCSSFHDLRVIGGAERFKVVLDVTPPAKRSEGDLAECARHLAERITAEFPKATVHVEMEPPYMRPDPDRRPAAGTPVPPGKRAGT
jgi:cation diffusion facilitator family transporter